LGLISKRVKYTNALKQKSPHFIAGILRLGKLSKSLVFCFFVIGRQPWLEKGCIKNAETLNFSLKNF